MNVTGYKRIDVSFQSIFEKILNSGSQADDNWGGTNPRQTGQGVAVSNVAVDFSAGSTIEASGLDLAISGNGLFILSPNEGESYLYTRAGNFEVDSSGNLTSNGMQVYGFNASGSLVPIAGLLTGKSKTNFRWQADGTLQYTDDPTATTPTYTNTGFSIALTYFPNPNGLAQAQGTSFAATSASGDAATASGPGGTYGSITPGYLEQSNVFYLGETIDALEIQRAMSGNLTVIRMASDMISQFINRLS